MAREMATHADFYHQFIRRMRALVKRQIVNVQKAFPTGERADGRRAPP